jgi:uncharacterized protein (TIGR02147 family)
MFSRDSHLEIFEYDHYRKFLRDFYELRKGAAEKLSFRHFARLAGFSSPSFLKMVIEGKRNLSHESIRKISEALRLNKEEAQYFTNLVLLNQADGVDEKRYYAEQLLRSRSYRRRNPLKSTQYDYYTSWYYVAIRELVATTSFTEDPEWIAAALEPSISPSEARAAIEDLLKLGLIVREPEGRLKQTEQVLTTGDEVDDASIGQFHREMMKKGSESIDRFGKAERDIASLTFGTGPKTAREIKELLQKFRKELIAVLVNSGEEATEVYQLNFQYFPLSRAGAGKERKR